MCVVPDEIFILNDLPRRSITIVYNIPFLQEFFLSKALPNPGVVSNRPRKD